MFGFSVVQNKSDSETVDDDTPGFFDEDPLVVVDCVVAVVVDEVVVVVDVTLSLFTG